MAIKATSILALAGFALIATGGVAQACGGTAKYPAVLDMAMAKQTSAQQAQAPAAQLKAIEEVVELLRAGEKMHEAAHSTGDYSKMRRALDIVDEAEKQLTSLPPRVN